MNKILIPIVPFLVTCASVWAQDALAPLELVERDQTGVTRSSDDIFNRNLALNSLSEYTDVSSYKRGAFGFYAHDGKKSSAWVMDPDQNEGTIEISWGLAVPINEVRIFEENSKAIDRLSLELYDANGWVEVSPPSPDARSQFNFKTRAASALRITIASESGAGGIAEVEVYHTESGQALPRYGSSELVDAMKECQAVILYEGGPYFYSRQGRALIEARAAETSLSDEWVQPVLALLVSRLGGDWEVLEADTIQLYLNGQTFSMDTGAHVDVIEQIKILAEKTGYEFLQRGGVVMFGQGLGALDRESVVKELDQILGRNPYRLSGETGDALEAVISPKQVTSGITYEWAGFRSTAIPGTNIDAWLKYAGTKAIRSWRHAPLYMYKYIRPKETIETAEDFERYRALLRSSPEDNEVVPMRAFLNKYHEEIAAEFRVYKQLGIEVINATGPKNWPNDLHNDFINWASTYMMTYYLAKNFNVAAHQFGNEPDWYMNQISEEEVQRRLSLTADAVHSAIEDVNRDYDRDLEAIFSAPVLAGNFTGRTARIMMRNLYTRYDGTQSEKPLYQLFNRHRYSGRPHQNALEVEQAKEMMLEEAGTTIPQVFTELNFSTDRHWRRPDTTFTNDTPGVFTSMASIWGTMMEEQGVYGIFVFKLNTPDVWYRPDVGRFSNTVTYSLPKEQDPDAAVLEMNQIGYGTKNFEVSRLFSKGFRGSRPLLETDVASSDSQYKAWTTFDADSGCYYIWSVQVNETTPYDVAYDLSQLDVPSGALVTVEAVSGALHGELTHRISLSADKKFRIRQAPQSAVLVTIHASRFDEQLVYAKADASIAQGIHAKDNFGNEALLSVGRHSDSDKNRMSLLKFDLPEGAAEIQRAVLELNGKSVSRHAYDGGFLFRVYAVKDQDWDEASVTTENNPYVSQTVSSLKEIDLEHYPLGHVTSFHQPSKMMVDLTQAARDAQAAGKGVLNLVLIREIHHPGEHTDDQHAEIASREAAQKISPKVYYYSEPQKSQK